MKRSRPIAGRHLGWDAADLATKPYARFLDPDIRPLPDPIRHALIAAPCPSRCCRRSTRRRGACSGKRPPSRTALR